MVPGNLTQASFMPAFSTKYPTHWALSCPGVNVIFMFYPLGLWSFHLYWSERAGDSLEDTQQTSYHPRMTSFFLESFLTCPFG